MPWAELLSDGFETYTQGAELPLPPWSRIPLLAGNRMRVEWDSWRNSWGVRSSWLPSPSTAGGARSDCPVSNQRQYGQGKLTFQDNFASQMVSIWLRMSHTDDASLQNAAAYNGYVIETVKFGFDRTFIWRAIGGAFVQLGQAPLTWDKGWGAGTWYMARGEANGATIRQLLDGVEKLSVMDATHPEGYPAGVYIDGYEKTRMDDWSCGHWIDVVTGLSRGRFVNAGLGGRLSLSTLRNLGA